MKLFLTPPVLQLASKHFTNEHMWQISLCVGISGISPLLPRHTDACALITPEVFPDAAEGTNGPTPQLTSLMLHTVPVWVTNYYCKQIHTKQT